MEEKSTRNPDTQAFSVLLIDDEPDLLKMTKGIFENAGYSQVMTAGCAKEAIKIMNTMKPSILILDVMMPDMDGFELLSEIRRVSLVPVLMLTAKGEAEDRYRGFELGADDYLVKPFLPKELLLRVTAILNRAYPQNNRIITLDYTSVDLDRAEVTRGNEVIPLTAKELNILSKLAENNGRIVTIGCLCEVACGEIWQGYESSLMTHIRHLREKIERDPSSPVSLLTVKGLGYKLIMKQPV